MPPPGKQEKKSPFSQSENTCFWAQIVHPSAPERQQFRATVPSFSAFRLSRTVGARVCAARSESHPADHTKMHISAMMHNSAHQKAVRSTAPPPTPCLTPNFKSIIAAGSLEILAPGPGPPAHAVRVRLVVIDTTRVHSEREEGKTRAKKVNSARISSGGGH